MTPPVFVLPPEALADATAGSSVRLSGAEGHHAATVRRLAVGEAIVLVDGFGRRVTGVVAALVDGQSLDVVVRAVVDEVPSALRVTVVQALAKGDRGELAVEQLTEVGVDVIVPWSAANCVVQWRGERIDRARRRWTDAALTAAKQARRTVFPVVTGLASSADVVDLVRAADLAILLHESAVGAIASMSVPESGDIVVIVGPEGGVSADERAVFAAAGAEVVRLGPTVLRTSSAGMAAVAVLLAGTARWSGPQPDVDVEG